LKNIPQSNNLLLFIVLNFEKLSTEGSLNLPSLRKQLLYIQGCNDRALQSEGRSDRKDFEICNATCQVLHEKLFAKKSNWLPALLVIAAVTVAGTGTILALNPQLVKTLPFIS